MALMTTQKLNKYFEQYSSTDVTFTKNVIAATRLLPKNVHLKILGQSWPCIIYSSSMTSAKIILSLDNKLNNKIREAGKQVSLRYSFHEEGKVDPISFFVNAKITGFTQYSPEKPELNFANLLFNKRPPDDLISVLGELLELSSFSQDRTDVRIIIDDDSLAALGFHSKNISAIIDRIPRKGLLRDVSFSGAKVIIAGIGKFLLDKTIIIPLKLDSGNTMNLIGKIVRYENVEGRKDLSAIAIQFDNKTIPTEYSIRLKKYLQSRKIEENNGA